MGRLNRMLQRGTVQRGWQSSMALGKGELPARRTEKEEKTIEDVPRQVADRSVPVQYQL